MGFIENCMIQKSFKKCFISNNLDGTEDDVVWTDVRDDSHNIDKEDEDDTYNNLLIEEQAKKLLADSSDKDGFLGFEQ